MRADYHVICVARTSWKVKAHTSIPPEGSGWKPLPVNEHRRFSSSNNLQSLTEVHGARRTYTSWDLPRYREIKTEELVLCLETHKAARRQLKSIPFLRVLPLRFLLWHKWGQSRTGQQIFQHQLQELRK